jgi:hypothetical protein
MLYGGYEPFGIECRLVLVEARGLKDQKPNEFDIENRGQHFLSFNNIGLSWEKKE